MQNLHYAWKDGEPSLKIDVRIECRRGSRGDVVTGLRVFVRRIRMVGIPEKQKPQPNQTPQSSEQDCSYEWVLQQALGIYLPNSLTSQTTSMGCQHSRIVSITNTPSMAP